LVKRLQGRVSDADYHAAKKVEQCEWTSEEFKKMTQLSLELIDWCHNEGVLGTFTFDSFYSSAEILNHINGLKSADGTSRGRWTGTDSVGTLHRSRLMLTAFDSPSEVDRPKDRETTAMQRTTLPYSLLIREPDKTSVSGWASVKLTTIGEGCRAMLRGSVSAMSTWVVEQLDATVKKGRNTAQHLRDLLRRLGLTSGQ